MKKKSIAKYLLQINAVVTAPVVLLFSVIALSGTLTLSSNVHKESLNFNSRLFTENIASDVLNGAHHEVSRKCKDLIKNELVRGVTVTSPDGTYLCRFEKPGSSQLLNQKTYIYYDADKTKTAAEVAIGYSNVVFSHVITVSVVVAILLSLAVLVAQIGIFRRMSKRMSSPFVKLAEDMTSGDVSKLYALRNDKTFSSIIELSALAESFIALFERIASYREIERAHAVSSAIARTTQMFAHDVRKPFSMIAGLLRILESNRNSSTLQDQLPLMLEEIQSAMTSVNGMIRDVMEIGGSSAPAQETVKPEELLSTAVNELFCLFPDSNVTISYNISHKKCVSAEPRRVLRVFANIFGNAVQAMNGKGKITISTTNVVENEKEYVRFAIANDGPAIAEGAMDKLFDAFYTSGKKGGTGLGLAIAQKIVSDHGGRIWCESREKGVVFSFTLPVSGAEYTPNRDGMGLPTCRLDRSVVAAVRETQASHNSKPIEADLECELIRVLGKVEQKINVLIVEDEKIYRNSLLDYLRRSNNIGEKVKVSLAENVDQAFASLAEEVPHLAIVDIDLGKGSMNGFELVDEFRKRTLDFMICIHSNRVLANDHRKAIEHGADAFLPKPMSRANMLTLLIQTIEKCGLARPISMPPAVVSEPGRELRIAVVDDDKIFQFAWMDAHESVEAFSSPEELLKKCEEDKTLFERIDCIICDNNFGMKSDFDGLYLGKKLRQLGFVKPLFLASNIEHEGEYTAVFDKQIGKDLLSPEELLSLLQQSRAHLRK